MKMQAKVQQKEGKREKRLFQTLKTAVPLDCYTKYYANRFGEISVSFRYESKAKKKDYFF